MDRPEKEGSRATWNKRFFAYYEGAAIFELILWRCKQKRSMPVADGTAELAHGLGNWLLH